MVMDIPAWLVYDDEDVGVALSPQSVNQSLTS